MDDAQFQDLAGWITNSSLQDVRETDLVAGFCERIVTAGVPLSRVSIIIDTLHPVYEGRAINWLRNRKETQLTQYGRNPTGELADSWLRSPFKYLLDHQQQMLRRPLTAESEGEFAIFPELRAQGLTDYVAMAHTFKKPDGFGIMDGVVSSWSTNSNHGFTDEDIASLQRVLPLLALGLKQASLTHIAETLVETYLGRDAGRRVLRGHIARGIADRMETVLWFSDLHGFTRITDTAAPEQIIPLLNEYAEVIIDAIHARGGDVMKLMGDGVLAIFPGKDNAPAGEAALAAAEAASQAIAKLNAQRTEKNLPTTDMYLGLHVGEVFYGNIGSKDRLDFTVVGPAVNEVSRIADLCDSVDQRLLLSSAFTERLDGSKKRLVSVGRYALRGVGRPQELFTLDPDSTPAR
jgi:adenylate cyclase